MTTAITTVSYSGSIRTTLTIVDDGVVDISVSGAPSVVTDTRRTSVAVSVLTPPSVSLHGVIVVRPEVNAYAPLEVRVDTAIGGNRLVSIVNSTIVYADVGSTTPVLGFTLRATASAGLAQVLSTGELAGFSGLVPGAFLYVGYDGVPTQTPPVIGRYQVVGVAVSDTKINISIQPPIYIG